MEFQLKNKLAYFEKNNIPITWETIKLGKHGFLKFEPLLNNQDVIDYSIYCIEREEDVNDNVLVLASLTKNDTTDINKLLNALAMNLETNKKMEMEKWIVVLLIEKLNDLKNDPIYDLIDLSEIYLKSKEIEVFPNFFLQGVSNQIEPQNYYTNKNCNDILDKTKKWIEEELKKFRN